MFQTQVQKVNFQAVKVSFKTRSLGGGAVVGGNKLYNCEEKGLFHVVARGKKQTL